ncbi:hypothetical protein FACS189440_01100 [Bacteroidia bacterium]|nr:hypothetical protein FACS189423_09360 [Bacteroidia bacterium]GHT45323.1 hypothetical protein FACS189440_01100 [Bacteroidia bacterium]
MKKMIFLMLTLIVLSAANVNAQVQIGGTKGPDKSAVLDLNGDAGTATGGLALPRVELANDQSTLNGVEPQPGTVVYNTGSEEVLEGTYVWTKLDKNASGIVSLPSDSGKILMATKEGTVWIPQTGVVTNWLEDLEIANTVPGNETGRLRLVWQGARDVLPPYTGIIVHAVGVRRGDICIDSYHYMRPIPWYDYFLLESPIKDEVMAGNISCYRWVKD